MDDKHLLSEIFVPDRVWFGLPKAVEKVGSAGHCVPQGTGFVPWVWEKVALCHLLVKELDGLGGVFIRRWYVSSKVGIVQLDPPADCAMV